MERVEETGQLSFLCACGGRAVELKTLGCCRSCYDRQYRSRRLFGGLRNRVLKRDGYRCRGCGSRSRVLVHHRDKRNEEELLLTLCIGCHMRVHHSYGFRHWLPAMLLRLWREWHEGEPRAAPAALRKCCGGCNSSDEEKKGSFCHCFLRRNISVICRFPELGDFRSDFVRGCPAVYE